MGAATELTIIRRTTGAFALAQVSFRTSNFVGEKICSRARTKGARTPSKPRWTAMFDFVRKVGEEQKRAFEALKEGRLGEYARDKVQRDLEEVAKVNQGLAKSRDRLARELSSVLRGAAGIQLEETLEELEEVLITADLGVDTTEKVLEDLRRAGPASPDEIKASLKLSLAKILRGKQLDTALASSIKPPTIIMVIGANGMGKTTTVGKLAAKLQAGGASVLVAACDTFRAAAVEQLAEWTTRSGAAFVAPPPNVKSPSGVLYGALERATAEGFDYALVDTSGRLHTNVNLMEELKKMMRVVQKFQPKGADEVLLVVDASIGRNAVNQAQTWKKEVGVTGLAVTKLDGTARAGFVISVVDELDIPVKLIGVGEGVDDLRDFDPELFVEGLVGE